MSEQTPIWNGAEFAKRFNKQEFVASLAGWMAPRYYHARRRFYRKQLLPIANSIAKTRNAIAKATEP